MNRFLFFICATAAMFALCACSSDDDFPSNEELDKLPTVDNPHISGFTSMKGDAVNSLNSTGDSFFVIHDKTELNKLNAEGRIAFIAYTENNSPERASLNEYYSNIDWSRQSLVVYLRKCPNSGGIGRIEDGAIYIDGNKFIISINTLWPSGILYLHTITTVGVLTVIDKPNLSIKDVRFKITETTDRGENAPGDRYKVTERWVKR